MALAPNATSSTGITPPKGPLPVPPKSEFQGLSIQQVNGVVQQVHDNHLRLFGTKAQPGLVFDVARGVAQKVVTDVHHLFDLPRSQREALVRQTPIPPAPSIPPLRKGLDSVISPTGMLDIDALRRLPHEKKLQYINEFTQKEALARKQQLALLPPIADLGEFVSQVSHSIKDIPFGVAKLVMAGGRDVRDAAEWPAYLVNKPFEGTPLDSGIQKPGSPTRTARLFEGVGKSIAYDFENPAQRPGYLFVDLLGAASLGAGTAARAASALGRAGELGAEASAAERVGTFARELGKRPYHPPKQLGFGAYQAYVPTFDNYFLRKLQGTIIDQINLNMARRHSPEAELSVLRKSRVYDFLFSPERWTKRMMDNQTNIDAVIETFPAHELARLSTWKARAEAMRDSIVNDRDLNAAWKNAPKMEKLSLGKLITLVFTEDPNPVAVWRSYHEQQIGDAVDQIQKISDNEELTPRDMRVRIKKQNRILKNHKAQLEALDGAVQMMENPHPQLQKVIDKAYEVSAQQERVKRELLGYAPFVMDRHNSEVAAIARGEKIAYDVDTKAPLGVVEAGSVEDKLLGSGVRNATNVLNREKRKLDTLEKNLIAPSKKTGAVADRPGLRAKIDAQREVVDAATNNLLVARHHQEILGSRINSLNVYERDSGATHPFYIRRGHEGEDVGFFPLITSKTTGITHIGEIGEEHYDLMERLQLLDPLPDAYGRTKPGGWIQGGGIVKNGKIERIVSNDEGEPLAEGSPIFKQAQKELGVELLRQGRGPGYISTRTQAGDVEIGGSHRLVNRLTRGKYGSRKPQIKITRMTGTALQMGENMIDMSDILVNEMTRSVRAGITMSQWQKVWDSAMSGEDFNRFYPNPEDAPYMQAVRDIPSAPGRLKKYTNIIVNQKIDKKLAAEMDEKGMQSLREWLYPKKDEILKSGDPHVRWFDERFFMDTIDKAFWMKADRLMSNVMAPLNEPFRFLLIFGTPAYLLNGIGAAAQLLSAQGFLAIPSLGRSFASSRIYGNELSRFYDVLAGATHAQALLTERNLFTQGSQKIAGAWQRATDLYFRRAAVIARLKEADLLDDSLSPEELLAHLQAPENRVAVRQAAQLGRQDMLDFEKMTWVEKATLRHLVFVYAFMRAGSIYSVRWLLEHPMQADVLEHVGEDRKKEIERLVGKTPSWFLNENYFPIGHDTVLNGVQLNIPDTLNQLAYPLASLFQGIPYQNPLDVLGPSASFWQELATGVQPGGQAVPQRYGGPLNKPVNTFLDMFAQTPPGHFLKPKKDNVPLPPAPVSSGAYDPISAAHSQESSALNQPTFDSNTLWNGWGPTILRSALPRHPNQAGMAARYWRDLKQTDPKAWRQHQLDLVHQMVNRQGKALGMKPPQEVLDAVDIVADRELYIADKTKKWQDAHKQSLEKGVGDRQLAAWTIDFLQKDALIDSKTAKRYRSALDQAQDSRQAHQIWLGALLQHTKAWTQWVQKADEVDSFTKLGFADILGSLKEKKLGDYSSAASAPTEAKWAYGRKFVNYTDRLHRFTEQMARAKRSTERSVLAYDMKDFIERNDKPVTIGGQTFPSVVRAAYAKLSPQEQDAKISSAATAHWTGLDSFTKELLTGQKPDSNVIYGYRNLATWVDAYKRDRPGERVPGYLKAGYVKYLEEKLPAFKQDYEFSRQTTAYRLQRFQPITKSPYADTWKQLLGLADQRARSLKKAGYTQEGINDQWKVYDLPEVQKWIDGLPIGFRREISRWVDAHPHFLAGLVH